MCPCGPPALGAAAWAEGRAGRRPSKFGRVSGGAFVPQPPRGETLAALLVRGAMLVRREAACFPAPGVRAGEGGGSARRSSPGTGGCDGRGVRRAWPGLLGRFLVAGEPVSGRSVGSPLKSNCCHV